MNIQTIIVCVALFASALPSHATDQFPDLLVYNSTVYELPARQSVFPLEDYYHTVTNVVRPSFSANAGAFNSTALWRGYIGIWEIRDASFFLTGIHAWVRSPNDAHRVSLTELFGDRCLDGRVLATWYSGDFSVQESFGVPDHRKLHITIQNGRVVKASTSTEKTTSQQPLSPR